MRWMSAFRAYPECISRGAYTPPLLALLLRPSIARMTFCSVHRPCIKSGAPSARRGSEMRWWTQCDFRRGTHAVHKSGVSQPAVGGRIRIGRHERHSSADRQRCVCGLPLQLRLKLPRGLRPPLLRRSANVCRRNNDFCDVQTYIRPRAAGVSPPWCASHLRHRKLPTVGLSRPFLTQRRSPIAKKTFSNTHAFLYQERRASARRDSLLIRNIGNCYPKRMSRSANRHPGDAATILLTVLVAAYFRLFGVAGIEGPAERPKQVLKKCRQPTRRRTCRMSLQVYLGAR
jgi:hypothetical protein